MNAVKIFKIVKIDLCLLDVYMFPGLLCTFHDDNSDDNDLI